MKDFFRPPVLSRFSPFSFLNLGLKQLLILLRKKTPTDGITLMKLLKSIFLLWWHEAWLIMKHLVLYCYAAFSFSQLLFLVFCCWWRVDDLLTGFSLSTDPLVALFLVHNFCIAMAHLLLQWKSIKKSATAVVATYVLSRVVSDHFRLLCILVMGVYFVGKWRTFMRS